jgi:putative tryptophan/tyrosine transport system substrate-binding protein
MRRRDFITFLGGAAAAWPLAARAQQAERMRRVGVLAAGSLADALFQPVFREAMAKSGWVEGHNLQIDFRPSEAPRLAADAEELVRLHPDVIFAFSGAAVRAAQRATRVIPIVFVGLGDPAQINFTGGVARPMGNATGFANNISTLGSRWLDLLKQAAPRTTKVARIYDPDVSGRTLADIIGLADARLSVAVSDMPVRDTDEIERAISTFAAEPNGGLLLTGPISGIKTDAILRLALQYRLPTMRGSAKLVADGLLMSNGPDTLALVRDAASYVDRILRGARPGDLPVQYPTKFPIVINLKTARAIGLEIPQTMLAIADEVIE